jgi:putative flippase GtrA
MKWSDSEGLRFLLAGGANTLIGYGVYLLLNTVFDYRVAYTLAFVAGILLSFVLNSVYVFRQRLRWRRLTVFPLVYLLQYAVGLVVVWTFVEVMRLPEPLAPWAAVAASLPVTYLAARYVLKPPTDVASQR